ncbi:MAG TPA: hypothetical protein VLD65_13110 [Anaerolineales bacterium]|nr:hypothetical protein [Anaerolineales bacterium]
MPTIEREIRTGETRQVGEYQITPQTQVISVRFPWKHSALIWNRPKAVLVRRSDGLETSLPVMDVTRVVIWSMLAGGLAGAILIGILRRK